MRAVTANQTPMAPKTDCRPQEQYLPPSLFAVLLACLAVLSFLFPEHEVADTTPSTQSAAVADRASDIFVTRNTIISCRGCPSHRLSCLVHVAFRAVLRIFADHL